MSTVERVTFKISGAYLTHQARSFVLEDNWDYALKFLMESLVGITTDQCLSILKGMKKLVGVNEVDIVDESEEELELYREQLGFLYHGIVSDGNIVERVEHSSFYEFVKLLTLFLRSVVPLYPGSVSMDPSAVLPAVGPVYGSMATSKSS